MFRTRGQCIFLNLSYISVLSIFTTFVNLITLYFVVFVKHFNMGWREPGNKTLQRGGIFLLVLFKKKVPDLEGRPLGQRQSGAGAGKRFLVLFRIIE